MDYDENSIFLKNRLSFLLWTSVISIVFILVLWVQLISYNESAMVFLSLFLLLCSFVLNLTLGNPGFLISIGFNALQTIVYTSNYFSSSDRVWLYLIGFSLASLMITMMFQVFVKRIAVKMDRLRKRALEEHSKRIKSENETLVKEAMQRTSLIVKHSEDEPGSKNIAADVINFTGNVVLDPLTTLPNRTRVIEHIDTLIGNAVTRSQASGSYIDKPIVVIYIAAVDSDIYSMGHGHRTNDLFIQCMAHRLREKADPSDIVGRVSGNEFVIITERDLNDSGIIDYASYLRETVASTLGGDTHHVYSGYACYPNDGKFPGELINNAEIAMRNAISNSDGDNIIGYSEISKSKGSVFDSMSTDEIRIMIDKALEDHEIRMVYQPRFNRKKELNGFEAFVRWESSRYGKIDTFDFLTAAELTGQIFSIGRISMEHAIKMLIRLNEINRSLTMTVNLSTIQLRNGRIFEDYKKASEGLDFIHGNLILDIPEESLITSFSQINPILDRFADEEIVMALDNFGRGYSSLNNIPLLPISIVKLDGHFTSELAEGSHARYLTQSIIGLLDEIGIPVDATGVGTQSQFETLSEFGCTYFQGKYLCDPLDDDDTVKYAQNSFNKAE